MRILRNARCCISQAVFLYATVTRLWEGGMPCVRLKSEDSLLNEEEWLREYDQTGNSIFSTYSFMLCEHKALEDSIDRHFKEKNRILSKREHICRFWQLDSHLYIKR